MTFKEYARQTKDPLNALVLVTPLFVAYQIGILFTGGIRNGVDFVTDALLGAIGLVLSLTMGSASQASVLAGYVVVNAFVLVALLVAINVLRKSGTLRPRLWPIVLVESFIYALFFGSTVTLLMRSFGLGALLSSSAVSNALSNELSTLLLSTFGMSASVGELLSSSATSEMGPFTGLISSIGAGLYEEIVFRLFLMGGLFHLFEQKLGQRPLVAGLLALVISSAIFSFIHHLGPMGDPFTLGVFFFRFFAGVVLAAIFALRGFAVAVYTHAIYDVLVIVIRNLI